MIGEKHDLVHELPEYRDQIHTLKTENAHFARLFAEYHQIEHEVRRIEENGDAVADDYISQQKIQRLHLKDQLMDMLTV